MGDETRTVIIDVEVEDKDFDKEIGNVNTALKENKELIKELSKDYKGNAKEIAKLEAENRDLSKSKQTLVKESKAESNSIDGLRLKLAKQTKERNNINLATKEGAARFKTLNQEIKRNSDTLKEAEQAGGDFRRNVGNYGSALDRVIPGLGGAITGLQGMTKAAIAFIATPLGLLLGGIALAIAAITSAFKGSEEGQNKFAKIMAVINVVLGNFQDLLADLGEKIISVFENPGQSIKDFGNLIKENITNRLVGILEFIPQMAKALELAWKRDFTGAAKVASDAVMKVTLGVENFTDKIGEAGQAVIDFGKQNVKESLEAIRVEQLRIEAREITIQLLEEGAKIEAKIAKLKLEARQKENNEIDASIQLLKDAQVLEDNLLELQLSRAEKLKEAQILENTFSRTNIENRHKEAEAVNAVSLVEIQRSQSADALQRRLNSLERRSASEKSAAIKKEAKEKDGATKKEASDAQALADLKAKTLTQGLDMVTQIAGEGSEVGKAAALAQIAYSTADAIAGLTANSQINPNNAWTFGAAGIAQFIAGMVTITTNIASAKKILNSKNPSTGGGGGGGGSSLGGGGGSVSRFTSAPGTGVFDGSRWNPRGQQLAGDLAGTDARNDNDSQRGFADSIVQVAVVDINTAQQNRQAKVTEAQLG